MSSIAYNRLERIKSQMAPMQANRQIHTQPTSGMKKPLTVVVSGAAGNIAYTMLFEIAAGVMLGPDQPIHLRLLEIPPAKNAMTGTAMELADGCFDLVLSVTPTTDYEEAFTGADIVILVGAKPRTKGMQRAQLLADNAKIFIGQGKALNKFASKTVKVLVVGNPCNTNALIAMTNAPDIPSENFTAMTRLDHHRASSMLASKTGLPVSGLKNMIIWGNHSATMYPDVRYCTIDDAEGKAQKVEDLINDQEFLRGPFIKTVATRGGAIIKVRGKSSAASAGHAAIHHVRSWVLGTPEGKWVSMGVLSDGSYGIPKGIIYSFPCRCKNGKWEIVQGLEIDEFSNQKMQASAAELLKEKAAATAL